MYMYMPVKGPIMGGGCNLMISFFKLIFLFLPQQLNNCAYGFREKEWQSSGNFLNWYGPMKSFVICLL